MGVAFCGDGVCFYPLVGLAEQLFRPSRRRHFSDLIGSLGEKLVQPHEISKKNSRDHNHNPCDAGIGGEVERHWGKRYESRARLGRFGYTTEMRGDIPMSGEKRGGDVG